MSFSESGYEGDILKLIGSPLAIQDSAVEDGHMETRLLHLHLMASRQRVDSRTGRTTHLILNYDEDEVFIDGRKAPATNLRGISGSGVWRTRESGRHELVGILTDHDASERRLVAVRPWLLPEALKQIAPELVYLLEPGAS